MRTTTNVLQPADEGFYRAAAATPRWDHADSDSGHAEPDADGGAKHSGRRRPLHCAPGVHHVPAEEVLWGDSESRPGERVPRPSAPDPLGLRRRYSVDEQSHFRAG